MGGSSRSNPEKPGRKRVKILLADDQRLMRKGLRTLIDEQEEMVVVGEADDGRRTLRLARQLSPDVIIMDVTMPNLNGINATRQILLELPMVKILALSVHSDRHFVMRMMKAGSSGYLLKDCAFDELITAIRTTSRGDIYFSPLVASMLINNYVRSSLEKGAITFSILTEREREILALLSDGKTTRQIAGHLKTSVKQVEIRRKRIMRKLRIDSLAGLTRYAIREGLSTL